MIQFFEANQPVVDFILLGIGFAFSQWIVLRAGVFSVANAGFTAIGAYTAAVLAVDYGLPAALTIVIGALVGMGFGLLIAVPLARLRGVYQAIATIAFVQIVVSVNLYAEGITQGALGYSVPKLVGTTTLLISVIVLIYLMVALNRSHIGRAFDAIRQDEAVASSLGVPVVYYQALAFALSGAIAGFFGGLSAFHSYNLEPTEFSFPFVIAALSFVVLGGRRTVLGPIVGAVVLIILPEFSRELGEFRSVGYGIVLMLVIAFLPRGIADTTLSFLRQRRLAQVDVEAVTQEGAA